MMETSLKRQKQTHILSKLRRPASSTVRHSVRLSRTPKKRLTIISLGIVTSLSIPALVFASQRNLTTVPSFETSLSDQENQLETSSPPEEVFSSSNVEMHVGSTPEASDEIVGHATINGETIPLTDGSVTTSHLDNNNSIDVDIAISNDDSSASISSSSSTEIHIESYSSSDDETNHTRGSPRR